MRRSALEEGRRWLEQAQEDLRWAKDLAERGGYHIACFLAQQIGEKALKGFLYAQGEEIVLGHSIERLLSHRLLSQRFAFLLKRLRPCIYTEYVTLPTGLSERVQGAERLPKEISR